jgi:hypothetical protein
MVESFIIVSIGFCVAIVFFACIIAEWKAERFQESGYFVFSMFAYLVGGVSGAVIMLAGIAAALS